ncbi:sulfotransferase family 2 domain-containing protein [Alteromonas lipotrueiana]|uniref:sulfotransferase family 2 domain-containing protein n=1 Tax=Alteromonas lipotrueiana TaxID=2803815 RepID=UPI001C46F8DA|nr:sulfotransferase family 2 domain-containing protein [Alteromonas lipotrueiana]
MQEMLKQQSQKYLTRYPRIFFCHVPKCAGVSLSKAIYRAVYPAFLKATRFTGHIDLTSSRLSQELLGIEMMSARESQLITHLNDRYMRYTNGHCIARPEVTRKYYTDWHFLTILRDPTDRFISEFVYNKFKPSQWQKHDDDIHTYLDSPKGVNSALTYARYFSGFTNSQDILANKEQVIESAVANLRQFSVIGTLDNMAQWQASFNRTFNTKIAIASNNKSPNQQASSQVTQDAAAMKKIEQLCAIDQAIYQQVVTMQTTP